MKALIVYDSVYGNTEKIAHAVGEGLSGATEVVKANEADSLDVKLFNLLIVGSPTHGGRPTEAIQGFLKGLTDASLEGINFAAFDTRMKAGWVRIFGFAAGRIDNAIKGKKGKLVAPPEGFFVKGRQGPILEGELERANEWGKSLFTYIK